MRDKVKFAKNLNNSSNILEEVDKGAFIPIIAAISGENTKSSTFKNKIKETGFDLIYEAPTTMDHIV